MTLSGSVERLIEELVASAAPVRRLKPPLLRTAYWLLAVGVVVIVAIAAFSDFADFERRAHDSQIVLETIGALLTGAFAVAAAFNLSLPDRSPAWALLPLPPFALWLASSGYNCYRYWVVHGPDGWHLGESAECFRFILIVSVPLGISLMVLLRRARPINPIPVALMGGLGVAGIAAFVLQFFHPFDITFMDLGAQLLAVGLVTALTGLAERVVRHH